MEKKHTTTYQECLDKIKKLVNKARNDFIKATEVKRGDLPIDSWDKLTDVEIAIDMLQVAVERANAYDNYWAEKLKTAPKKEIMQDTYWAEFEKGHR